MKTLKRMMALVIALVMVLGMSTMAMAADGDEGYTITMKTTSGHTYTAYQVFSGDLDETTVTAEDGTETTTKTLSNIEWGDGVNGDALLNALKADTTYGSSFADCKTAADVAEVLADYQNDSDAIKAIAKIIAANKKGEGSVSVVGEDEDKTITISGLDAGYYLVVDTTAADDMPEGNTYSDFILEVVSDVEVTAKDTTTTSEKKVQDDDETKWQDSADWAIGDKVPFQLTGHVASDYDKYSTYYFAFHDTESAGLSFNTDSVKVTIDGTDVSDSLYEVKKTEKGFDIVFEDLKKTAAEAGSTIVVTYTSTLTENAVIGSTGNPNTMYVEFSNNPNDNRHGETKPDTVIVFTYKLVVDKVDEEGDALTGAGFTLYKVVDGEETAIAVGKDADGNLIYELTGEQMTQFEWKGLDDGTYKLKETTTPSGYNTMADITFTIKATHDENSDDPKLTKFEVSDPMKGSAEGVEVTKKNGEKYKTSSGEAYTEIINEKGSELPSTGGIGTTIFYIVGAILVIGAGVVLVTRRRMNAR